MPTLRTPDTQQKWLSCRSLAPMCLYFIEVQKRVTDVRCQQLNSEACRYTTFGEISWERVMLLKSELRAQAKGVRAFAETLLNRIPDHNTSETTHLRLDLEHISQYGSAFVRGTHVSTLQIVHPANYAIKLARVLNVEGLLMGNCTPLYGKDSMLDWLQLTEVEFLTMLKTKVPYANINL